MKKSKKDNPVLLSVIERLLKEKKPIWKRVARDLSKPRRQKVEVNISRLEEKAPSDSTVLVPGKVLGSGNLTKKLGVAAFSFSNTAKSAIEKAGGKTMRIDELCESRPDGKGVVLFK